MTEQPQGLRTTALHAAHVDSGAKMVPFGGWDMPVQYTSGIIAEVKAVRSSAGIFDVSHMGRVEFSGPGSESFLGTILSANLPAIKVGRGKYNFICNQGGGIIDDAMVYRTDDQQFILVINAGNAEIDMEWINPRAKTAKEKSDFLMTVVTTETAMIAVQGPDAVEIIDGLSKGEASKIRRFCTGTTTVDGIPATLFRTGYTGEDGFEIVVTTGKGPQIWSALKHAGAVECGLGARDVLRLEAGLPLHGNELTKNTDPFEAGFGRFAYHEAEGFVAAKALKRLSEMIPERRLIGFKMTGRGIPRTGLSIQAGHDASNVIGTVTSGTHSPTVDGGIGMGYVDQKYAETGSQIVIDVRGRLVEAEVVDMPFYKRG